MSELDLATKFLALIAYAGAVTVLLVVSYFDRVNIHRMKPVRTITDADIRKLPARW